MRIGFSLPTSWNPLSWLIQKITKSQWSHCFIILDEQIDGDYLILEDSMIGGVRLNLLSAYQKNHTLQTYTILNNQYTLKPLHSYIGDNYAYLGLLGEAIAKLLKLKRNPITLDMVCSGLVLRFLMTGPLAFEFNTLNLHNVSPQDIYSIITKSPDFKKDT